MDPTSIFGETTFATYSCLRNDSDVMDALLTFTITLSLLSYFSVIGVSEIECVPDWHNSKKR